MPVVLDTDHLSVLQWQEQPACTRLLARLDQLPPDDIATTIISFQEQIQGWLAYLSRARKPEQIVQAYSRLPVGIRPTRATQGQALSGGVTPTRFAPAMTETMVSRRKTLGAMHLGNARFRIPSHTLGDRKRDGPQASCRACRRWVRASGIPCGMAVVGQ